jgi:hypothetical protein
MNVYAPISGFADIPSNFDIDDNIIINVGSTAACVDTDEGKLRFLCNPGHLSYNDPILYPGQEGAAHLHHFFGNSFVDHNSTYTSLRTLGDGTDGTCGGKANNRTGYWFPAMIKPASAGVPAKVAVPYFIEMYYQNEAHDLDDYQSTVPAYNHYKTWHTTGFPNGLQMVFGWKHDHPLPPPSRIWQLDHPSWVAAGGVPQGTLQELYTYSVGCTTPPYGYVTARITSLPCWDGANLTTPNGRDHMAQGFEDGDSHFICPETHPYRIPLLLVIVTWPNVSPEEWRHWFLSVDRHTGHNLGGGHGFHTDWFGAWDPVIQDIWENEHLSLGTTFAASDTKSSSDGVLCRDDEMLTNSHLAYTPINTYADIPAAPGQKRLRLNLTAA